MTRSATVFSLILLAGIAQAAPLGRMRLEGSPGSRSVYRLYLQGKATPLTTETPGYEPSLEVKRTPSGLVYGQCSHVESGAYLVSYSLAFLKFGKDFWSVSDSRVVRAHGKTALVQEIQTGIWSGGLKAKWFDGQRLNDVGPSDASYMPAPNIVRGYYYCDEASKPVNGMFSEFRTPIYRQYFEWKAGVRTEKGRVTYRKALEDGTSSPQLQVKADALSVNAGAPSGAIRLLYRDKRNGSNGSLPLLAGGGQGGGSGAFGLSTSSWERPSMLLASGW